MKFFAILGLATATAVAMASSMHSHKFDDDALVDINSMPEFDDDSLEVEHPRSKVKSLSRVCGFRSWYCQHRYRAQKCRKLRECGFSG